MNVDAAHRIAEQSARNAYGRLVAYLAARWQGDLMAVEDALGEAFVSALEKWPLEGTPDNPDAWLLVTARRRLMDGARHHKVRDRVLDGLLYAVEESERSAPMQPDLPPFIPDERLALLFACAHPAIDRSVRTPLMLQTVLGMTAVAIGSAFLVSPATMGQRLVRAKTKIRDAGIRFEVPDAERLPDRLDAVLEAIYAAYTTGWDDVAGADAQRKGLADEAIWLGRMVVSLLPDAPEAKGLLALMLHCEARRPARVNADGDYVPLSSQDTSRWLHPYFAEAEALLHTAVQAGIMGRFQLEAAIQSAHSIGRLREETDWQTIVLLYDGLVGYAPTAGAYVSRAAALANARGPVLGLEVLAELPYVLVKEYQPYWALKADLLARNGEAEAAVDAYTTAIGLSEDVSVRRFLAEKRRQCESAMY